MAVFEILFLVSSILPTSSSHRLQAANLVPPLQPPEFGARGPRLVCAGNIAIYVEGRESIYAQGASISVINDGYRILIDLAPHQRPLDTGSGEAVALGGGLLARSSLMPAGSEDAVRLPYPRYVAHYRIAVTRDASAFAAEIDAFTLDPSVSVQDIVARLRPAPKEPDACVRPLEFEANGQNPVQVAEMAGFVAYQQAGLVSDYPPDPIPGPAFHCRGGIGFAIEPGETLLRPWKPLGIGTSWLSRDGMRIEVSGPGRAMRRVDPDDAREHPMSPLHKTSIVYYKSRGVGPPYTVLPGAREDGSWEVELGNETYSKLQIRFSASASSFGFSFLERLEFVDQDDPRCRKD